MSEVSETFNLYFKEQISGREFEIFKIDKSGKKIKIIFNDGKKEYIAETDLKTYASFCFNTGEKICSEKFNEFCKEADYQEGLDKLLKFLKKGRSSFEIKNYLKFILKTLQVERYIIFLEEMQLFDDEKYIINYFNRRVSRYEGPKLIIEKLIYEHNIDKGLVRKTVNELYSEELIYKQLEMIFKRTIKNWHSSINHFIEKFKTTLVSKGFLESSVEKFLVQKSKEIKMSINEKKNLLIDFEKVMDKYYFLTDEEEKQKGFLKELTKKGYNEIDIINQIKEY